MKKTVIIIFLILLPFTASAARLAPGAVPEQVPLQPIPVDVAPNLKESVDRVPEQSSPSVEIQDRSGGGSGGVEEKRAVPDRCISGDGSNRCAGVPLEPKKNFPVMGLALLGIVLVSGAVGVYMYSKRGKESSGDK